MIEYGRYKLATSVDSKKREGIYAESSIGRESTQKVLSWFTGNFIVQKSHETYHLISNPIAVCLGISVENHELTSCVDEAVANYFIKSIIHTAENDTAKRDKFLDPENIRYIVESSNIANTLMGSPCPPSVPIEIWEDLRNRTRNNEKHEETISIIKTYMLDVDPDYEKNISRLIELRTHIYHLGIEYYKLNPSMYETIQTARKTMLEWQVDPNDEFPDLDCVQIQEVLYNYLSKNRIALLPIILDEIVQKLESVRCQVTPESKSTLIAELERLNHLPLK